MQLYYQVQIISINNINGISIYIYVIKLAEILDLVLNIIGLLPWNF